MIEEMKPLFGKLTKFAMHRMGFAHPPKLFLKNDAENSQKAFGKTAFYDPQNESVTLFIQKRHPKDILRSLAHELVHHTQNLRGDLSPEKLGSMGKNYAQDNEHMRNMEKEAYLQGNMCFRDFEDSLDDKEIYTIKIVEAMYNKEAKTKQKLLISESKHTKESKKMTTKITKEFLKKTIEKILKEEYTSDEVVDLSEQRPRARNIQDFMKKLTPAEKKALKLKSGTGNWQGMVRRLIKKYDKNLYRAIYKDRTWTTSDLHLALERSTDIYDSELAAAAKKRIAIAKAKAAQQGQVTPAQTGTDATGTQQEETNIESGTIEEQPGARKGNEDRWVGKGGIQPDRIREDDEDAVDTQEESQTPTTPEKETKLQEGRFGARNTRLYEKLLKAWTK